MTLATLYLWNQLTSWELRTLTWAVTFNPSLWIRRESERHNCRPCQAQKEQLHSIKQFRNQLPMFLLQQISILFQGDIWTVNAEERIQTFALREEYYPVSLQSQRSGWGKKVFLPNTNYVASPLSWEFSQILRCGDELTPGHGQDIGQWTHHIGSIHAEKAFLSRKHHYNHLGRPFSPYKN